MIEEGDEADGGFLVEGGRGFKGVDEAEGAAIGHFEVVEAGGEDKFGVEAADAGWLGVVEDHFEIDDVGGFDTSFFGDEVDDVGVMAFGGCFKRLEIIGRSIRSLFLSRCALLGLSLAVKLRCNEASDGEQLRLLIEGECFLAV